MITMDSIARVFASSLRTAGNGVCKPAHRVQSRSSKTASARPSELQLAALTYLFLLRHSHIVSIIGIIYLDSLSC